MKRALIEKATNRFAQRVDQGQEFPVHSGLEWRDCPGDATPETHDFDGSSFALKSPPQPPPPPTVDELEAEALATLDGAGMVSVPFLRMGRLFKARMISDLAFRLGKVPGALTNAELLAERNRIAAIYKAL